MAIDCICGFPSPILSFTHDYYDKFKDDLIDHIYSVRDKTNSEYRSNNGGWQSPPVQLPERFTEYIFSNAAEVLELYLGEAYTAQVGNLWYNINPSGASNDRHTHPGCDLACCFYVKVPEGDSGDLELENPNHFGQFNLIMGLDEKLKEETRASHSLWFKPEEGATVIFPANIMHRVMKNNTDQDRISIAWNMRVIDKPVDVLDNYELD